MAFAGINYLAVLIATIAGFAFGAAYYMSLSQAVARRDGQDQGGAFRLGQGLAGAVHRLDRGAGDHGLGAGRHHGPSRARAR